MTPDAAHPPLEEWILLAEGEAGEGSAALVAHAGACNGCARLREEAESAVHRILAAGPRIAEAAALPFQERTLPGPGYRPGWAAAAAALLALAAGVAALAIRARTRAETPPAVAERPALRPRETIAPVPAPLPAPPRGAPIAGPGVYRILSGGRVTFDASARGALGGAAAVRLDRGSLLVEEAPRGFRVATPHGEVEDLGTSFRMRVSEAETSVEILRGSVRAASGGETRILGAGERAVLALGVRIEPPARVRAEHEVAREQAEAAIRDAEAALAEARAALERLAPSHKLRESIRTGLEHAASSIREARQRVGHGDGFVGRRHPESAISWYESAADWADQAAGSAAREREQIRGIAGP